MSIQQLFEKGVISVAAQPANNSLDANNLGAQSLCLFPIDHDYPGGSAAMHNAVYEHYGLPFRSCFVIGKPADAEKIVAAFKADPLYVGGGAGSGFKDKVGPFLDRMDQSAQAIGSVNVIAKENGELVGYNTDGLGFVNGLLEEYPDCIAGKKVVILGAGGTALPIAYEMSQKQPKELVICNRTVAKAEKIAELVAPFCTARGTGEDVIGDELATADVVVNTSNKGAQPNEQYSAFSPMTGDPDADMRVGEANLARLPVHAIVADILLEAETLSLAMAAGRGNPIHRGHAMNLHQAVPAFRIMTKLDKPADEVKALMKATIG